MTMNFVALIILSLIGLLDASYITFERFSNRIPPCSDNIFYTDCGKVLDSAYATIFSIPVSVLGILYYVTLLSLLIFVLRQKRTQYFNVLHIISLTGFITSLYLIFLQIYVIQSICLYCMISAFCSITIFIILSFIRKSILLTSR